jgi:predicted ATPase
MQQKEIIAQFGPMNPIAGLPQVFNTLEDITKLHGLNDVSRYFAPLTEEAAQQLQQIMQQAQENQPLDPGNAMLQAEKLKAELRAQEKLLEFTLAERRAAIERQIQALEFAAKDDLERDRMAQQLQIAETRHEQSVDVAAVRREQDKPREAPYQAPTE